ncbi:ATP-binding protein [[Clostridium] sordellii]|uniref:ATPase n=1 Tax=Paraclostridium sordellii TaxID=1505 RepID=A0ABP1XZB5_PARSO|nr:ATP-binding protein [Paeniclostridium sordellii]CEJ75172.1 putative ATPase [[Clostridium] sordellii] [Paeniclostridium sordellii]CEN70941.1 ATP-binding protein [[Clostridium] sordellii] [Paeniclostridium sordellii]CEN74232.1 ATP-binding protein [[Clostridium] sordellii] [Paeniclostridium sordellii]CEO30373.1 ATP-binding protein [[Clostridium] sordellii] [Paeniclostridium sordellii]CEP65812.1 ATP-binding protein [[Clostridium] sordellii] [Paeniclostridium sordellii]
MKKFALVGESGTGKSYKALELAYENNINYIVDDGILIKNNKILAGVSAKQAKTKIQAVKRAIFENIEHRECVRTKLKEEKIDKILVIGTSDKMVNKIAERLGLGSIDKTIYINEISKQEEIEIAKKSRERGNHIIPVPTLEVKSIASGLSINPIKRLFKRGNSESIIVEKTIVRPSFSYIGKFYITQNAINEIIYYELSKIKYISKINNIQFKDKIGELEVKILIEINIFEGIESIYKLQKHIMNALYKVTLINVSRVDININKIKKC